jgi:16S rRNA (adenine1518-N6/adenine1519-N6)-dimethyltransferase
MAVKELPLEEILAIAESIDLEPDPAKGQYFLHDADAIRRVASSCAVTSQDDVVVAGAGMGALTLALLAGGAKVTAVDINPLLTRQLPSTVADRSHSEICRLVVIERDVMELHPSDLDTDPSAVLATLPPSIAVEALVYLLDEFPSIRSLTAIVDAAVQRRLAPKPGTTDYDVAAARLRYFTDVHQCGELAPSAFWPSAPDPQSVVRFDRIDEGLRWRHG